MVTDNFCFVVDGNSVELEDITASEDSQQWWRPTGRSIRYYCSDSLKTFYQVAFDIHIEKSERFNSSRVIEEREFIIDCGGLPLLSPFDSPGLIAIFSDMDQSLTPTMGGHIDSLPIRAFGGYWAMSVRNEGRSLTAKRAKKLL